MIFRICEITKLFRNTKISRAEIISLQRFHTKSVQSLHRSMQPLHTF
uniref:Uncharacterized protein n=1 Tax=Podoviridae sp. ctARy1 TaxID=2825228 RepID=A0A8S5TSN3_9CAUD|nr:MAG TPA: hypothetical protein [Podoviridae sp. ctARy1]